MRKAMMFGLLAALTLAAQGFVPACGQAHPRSHSAMPKACYFFDPTMLDKARPGELADERAYWASVLQVYRAWCKPGRSDATTRKAAADAMVARWKVVWDRDDPYDTEFHEMAAFDLLELLGLTHELPAQMANNLEFVREWVQACNDSCFTIWSVPQSRDEEHDLAVRLWLQGDLLDNMKREPGSEPVIEMLQHATYRLVN